MTKADRIRTLYKLGWSVKEIAREVGCRDGYVRVCARQRADGSMSVTDKRYFHANREKVLAKNRRWVERYRTDAEFRQRAIAASARSRQRRKASREARA